MHRIVPLATTVLGMLGLIACVDREVAPAIASPLLVPDHIITQNANGSFSPMWTHAHESDVIQWNLTSRTSAVVPATWSGAWPAICSTPKAWSDTDANNFTGPRPIGQAGVYALSAVGPGLVSQPTPCALPEQEVARVGVNYLCATGAVGQTMTSTWTDPNIDGVFVRLLWNQLEPTDCTSTNLATCWNWSAVDREVAAAVANGKLYSIAVKAGDDGTPDWLFTTDADGAVRVTPTGGVTRLHLQDSGNDTAGCGQLMDLGDPTEQTYQDQYFDMLTALAGHLKSRGDWYRALAAVKPSGANLQSHENRLPKRCDTRDGCLCNTEILALRGYTPAGLYDFYTEQFELLADLFPGKAQSYALIQQGFPRIKDAGCYQIDDAPVTHAVKAFGCPIGQLPGASEQTDEILDLGAAAAAANGLVWTVSHNGLGPSLLVGGLLTGLPNQHVLDAAAADTTTLTGFQTNNSGGGVPDTIALDDTFANLETNAPEATYLEIYEARQWEAQQKGGVLDATPVTGSGLTLGGWGTVLRDRRAAVFPILADPDATVHQATVHYTIAFGAQIIHYVDPSKCSGPTALYGAVSITP